MTKKISGKSAKVTRRTFIVASAAAGGGLALGFNAPFGIDAAIAQEGGAEVTPWVVTRPDATTAIRTARSEMGKGRLTGFAKFAAEELERDWTRSRSIASRPAKTSRAS